MSDEALQALLSGSENTPSDDLSGVPAVSGDDVVAQLQPEKVEEEQVEEPIEEEQPEEAGSFLDTLHAVEISDEEAYGLQVPMQDPEGNKVFKTVGELKDEYKKAQELNALAETTKNELASRQAELEGKESTFRMAQSEMLEMPQELYEVNARIVATEQHIKANQDSMMKENPGGLALVRQELQSLQYQRDNLQQQILNQRESVQQSLRDEQMIQQNRTLAKQTEQMLNLIPEWNDQEVRKSESQALIDYGVSKGFSQQQMTTIADPNVVKYMRDQMVMDQRLANVKPNDDMPTPLRPQVVKPKATADRAAHNKLIKKAKESRDPRVKNDAIVALLSQ
jgi:predicted  nucleic acid-binding Zn-ribbon protein